MKEIIKSETFTKWLDKLKDRLGRVYIARKIEQLHNTEVVDSKQVSKGVYELRIHYGPGYRVYYCIKGNKLIILLCGGDKDSQDRDIIKAKELAKQWEA